MPEAKTVPKFGSFRPKVTPQPPQGEGEKHRSRGNARTVEKGSQKHRRHRHHSRSPERSIHVNKTSPSHAPRTIEEKSSDVFFIDRKGDEKNVAYGSIHRYSVPAFYRFGGGGVLGAPSNLKIDPEYGGDREVALYNWRDSIFPYREKYVFSRVERERPRLLKFRTDIVSESLEDLSRDFVPLESGRGKKRKRVDTRGEDNPSSEDDRGHYRSIHGNSNTKGQPTDGALQNATDSEASDYEELNLGSSVSERQRNADLSCQVEQKPYDTDAWLALIEHQDILLRGQDNRRRFTNAEMQSTADIKIHLYEKAIGKATCLKDRERLLRGLMFEGSKIWETKIQSNRWEQISKDNIDSSLLWKSYVAFKQGTFSIFRYEDTRDISIKRIKLLSSIASTMDSSAANSVYQQILYILLRLTTFMRESGYSELAVAIWQGLLEINFMGPNSTPLKKESFGSFWESEVARIGDDDARGWRHFVENGYASEPEPQTIEVDKELDGSKLFQSWAAAELSRCRDSFTPARTMDDVAEDDPFRVILFPDIEDFLVVLPSKSEELHKSLIDAFLLFCKMPPMQAWDQETFQDASAQDNLLECDHTWMSGQMTRLTDEESYNVYVPSGSKTPFPNFTDSPETIFASKFWFSKLHLWKERYAEGRGPVSYKWLRNILKQLTQVHFREDLAEYYLALEWRNAPETIKAVSKALLKQHPSCLRLYNAYAMIEHAKGNKDVANSVFSTALKMNISLPQTNKRDSILLWKSWIWAHLEASDKDSALQCLFSIADTTIDNLVNSSPTILLKARQHLVRHQDYLMSAGDTQHAILYCECLALFRYLTSTSSKETISHSQGDIGSALTTYKALSDAFVDRNLSKTSSHELLLQYAARLLYHHARIGPFRPALLREHLSHFITLFPQNTIFLSLYTWNESRLRIDNRVRHILFSTVLVPEIDVLSSRLFAIYYEINHGTVHSVLSAFEHAVSSPASKASAGLWKFYVLYCLVTPQFQSQVKDVWYRAIRACPWAKELYILGFAELSGMIPFEELKQTWRIMGEKGLRVHIDLEDKFEEIEDLKENERGKKRLAF